MSDWTCVMTDTRTGRVLNDDLKIEMDPFTDAIGVGNGAFSASIKVNHSPLRLDPDLILVPWQRVFWPCRDGQPFGAFVIVAEQPYKSGDPAISFTAQRFDYIWKWRQIESTLVFNQVDQNRIGRDLMLYGLGMLPVSLHPDWYQFLRQLPVEARLPWVMFDTSLSGQLRDRGDDSDGFQAAGHKTIHDAITSLMGVEGGFEYRPVYYLDTGDIPRVRLELGTPKIGRELSLPLEYPGSITQFTYATDGGDMINYGRVYGAAATSGASPEFSNPAIRQDLLDDGQPLLMGSDSSNAILKPTLDAQASGLVTALSGVNRGFTVSLSGNVLGTYGLGDNAQLRIDDARWARPLVQDVRLTGHRITPGRGSIKEEVVPTIQVIR